MKARSCTKLLNLKYLLGVGGSSDFANAFVKVNCKCMGILVCLEVLWRGNMGGVR
jgi:hypothetical protein